MAAIANIVIADGQVAPVNHTFVPHLQEGSTSVWLDKVSGIVAGYTKLMSKGNSDSLDSEVQRVRLSIELPTLETLAPNTSGFTPGPTVAYSSRFIGEFIIPKRATLQERKDMAAYAKNLLALAVVTSMVVDNDLPY